MRRPDLRRSPWPRLLRLRRQIERMRAEALAMREHSDKRGDERMASLHNGQAIAFLAIMQAIDKATGRPD